MRRLLVMAAVAMLVLGSVQLVGAATPVAPRHIEGSFVALGDPVRPGLPFEIRANATGRAGRSALSGGWDAHRASGGRGILPGIQARHE
jgi:hypothetical protein